MSKLIILTQGKDLYTNQRFFLEAKTLGMEAEFSNPQEQDLCLNPTTATPQEVKHFLVLHRISGVEGDDVDLDYNLWWEERGARTYNSWDSLIKTREKQRQILWLSKKKLAFVPSYIFRGRFQSHHYERLQELFHPLLEGRDEFVVKMHRGNQGLGVVLIRGRDSLTSFMDTFWAMKDQRFLIQPYLKNFEEYRALIVENEILCVLKRKGGPTDFRANFHQEGKAEVLTKNEISLTSLSQLPQKILAAFGLFYASLDFLRNPRTGEFLVLDINTMPGLEQCESLTGENLTKKILSRIEANSLALQV